MEMANPYIKIYVTYVLYLLVRCEDPEPYFLSNLNDSCMKCLCHAATGCNMTLGCEKGYCGMYKISRLYWIDADKQVLPEDDPERAGSYEDCSINLACAKRIIQSYLAKFARDCNGDNVTDCYDYSMINFNGGYQCHPPLNRNPAGKNWTARYEACVPR